MSLATLKMIDDARNKLCAESVVDEDGCYTVRWDSVVLALSKIRHHLEESLKRDGQYFVEEEV